MSDPNKHITELFKIPERLGWRAGDPKSAAEYVEAELDRLERLAALVPGLVDALATLGGVIEANNSIIKRFAQNNPMIGMALTGEYIEADLTDAEQTLREAREAMKGVGDENSKG